LLHNLPPLLSYSMRLEISNATILIALFYAYVNFGFVLFVDM
jgi:hypothetical protein